MSLPHLFAALLVFALAPSTSGQSSSQAEPTIPRLSTEESTTNTSAGVIGQVEFRGLRRISPATLRRHLGSHPGQPVDSAKIEQDVRALDRLGWFEFVIAELHPAPLGAANEECGLPATHAGSAGETYGLRLVFVLQERPFLAGVDFRGSHVLPRERIRSLLDENGISLAVAAPAKPADLSRAARAIEAALAELGYPQARVRVRLKAVPTAAVRATFEVHDGPRITVRRVTFDGNRAFTDEKLQKQLKRVAPHAVFAGSRGKTIFTAQRLAEDLEKVADFYRNHGYPEARLGDATVAVEHHVLGEWFPWPRRRSEPRLHISIPVEEGRLFRLGTLEVRNEAGQGPTGRGAIALLHGLRPGQPYSQQEIEQARQKLARLTMFRPEKSPPAEVEVKHQFDPAQGVVHVTFRVRPAARYVVRRIEFSGHRRFSDRYYRRRALLKEAEPFDPEKLETGLAQLARSGFIRPVSSQDLRVEFDDVQRTADVAIHVHEIGRQRFSLVGGNSAFGSTLGIVYNVFDLFGHEELLTGHLEGGPESLQVLMGLAKEGLFGTRASLGLNLFHTVIRPRLPGGSPGQRLFTSRSSGLGLGWSYPVGSFDSVSANYEFSRIATQHDFPLLPSLAGSADDQVRTRHSSRSLSLAASRDTGRERLDASAGISGGWLGGDEHLLRSSLEYAQQVSDPLSRQRNLWAFRGYFAGVSSYRGGLPLHARIFAGDQLVRGFRAGELSPVGVARSDNADGSSSFQAYPAGANLLAGVNSEYRAPVTARIRAATFFDAGAGWLIPRWLASDKPVLLAGTNGLFRTSTGIELSWRLPGVEQPLRLHYTFNSLRLTRSILLPDGSSFSPSDRPAAWGWALGSLF